MDPTRKTAIEWLCSQLALRFIGHSDRQEWAEMCALLTEDASFARPTDPDNPIIGRAAIQAAFEARPADRITRHVCSNHVIVADSYERATGRLYATLYTGAAGNDAALGTRADSRRLLGEFEDVYVSTDEGWRIASRTGRIIFTVD